MSGIKGMRRRTIPQTEVRARIWQSMRILRRFTLPDLIATAEATRTNVGKYVRALEKVGVLRVVRSTQFGRPGGYKVVALVRDLGPFPPRVQKHGGVWDPNAHTVLAETDDER